MGTAIDQLLDLTISHSVGLERYKLGLVKDLIPILNATNDDVEGILAQRLVKILRAGYDAGPVTTDRVLGMLDQINSVRSEAYNEISVKLVTELIDLMGYEVAWQEASFQEVLIVDFDFVKPTAELLKSAMEERPFEGHLFKDWADDLAPSDLARIQQQVQLGVVEGKTIDDIVGSVVGTRDAAFADGAFEVSRRGLDGFVRTSVNHVVTQAREETYSANSDIIEGVRWCSTLDGRTTLVCIDRDGKIFPIREGPRPPAHFKCRSSTMPTFDGMALIGNRPFVSDSRDRSAREVDFRQEAKDKAGGKWSEWSTAQRNRAVTAVRQNWASENIGQVPAAMTYGEWLKKQPASFQNEVLGQTRGELFRRGGLTVDSFVDGSGRTLTLDELRQAEAQAFKKAKIGG